MSKRKQPRPTKRVFFIAGLAVGIYLALPCNSFTFSRTERRLEQAKSSDHVWAAELAEIARFGYRVAFAFFLATSFPKLRDSKPSAATRNEDYQ